MIAERSDPPEPIGSLRRLPHNSDTLSLYAQDPQTAPFAQTVAGSVYSSVTTRADPKSSDYFPLHVGDSYLGPPPHCGLGELPVQQDDHQYTATAGIDELREALAASHSHRTGCQISSSQVYVTASATAGLHATVGALCAPGDEILLLAPYWPLIEGMVRGCGGVPRAVPVLGEVGPDTLQDRLNEALSEKTVAIYFSSPNNPSGKVFDPGELQVLAETARKHELWLIGDDVYEHHCYSRPHTSALGLAPERTIVAYSSSKSYAMAGYRCGWLIAPQDAMGPIQRLGTHAFYSAPTLAQRALLAVLEQADDWLLHTNRTYRALGTEIASIVGEPPPEGGTFLFVDCTRALDERGLQGLLEDCADRGLLLAPGTSFGPFPEHVRLCFTCAKPEVTKRGAKVLADLLNAGATACR